MERDTLTASTTATIVEGGRTSSHEVTARRMTAGTVEQRILTAVIFYCNLCLGIIVAFLAPALIELTKAFSTDVKTMSVILTISRALGICGSLAFGYIFGVLNRHAVVTLLVFVMSASLFLMLYSGSLTVFAVLFGLMSLATGGYITAQAVWVIDLWKDKAGPWIQGQHFFFALGCVIPPVLFAPFLDGGRKSIPSSPEGSPNSSSLAVPMSNLTIELAVIAGEVDPISRLYIPTVICAAIVGVGGISLLITFFAFRKPKKRNSAEEEALKIRIQSGEAEEADHGKNIKILRSNKCRKVCVIMLSAILIGTFTSMEITVNQFFPAYAHFSGFQLSEADAARLFSAYSITFLLSRLVGIFISLKVDAKLILAANILTVVIASLLLAVSSTSSGYENVIWLGSVLLGIGLSTNVPTTFSFVKSHLEVTNMVASIMSVGGSSMSISFPIVVGTYIVTFADIVVYLIMGTAVVGALTLGAIVFMVRGNTGKL